MELKVKELKFKLAIVCVITSLNIESIPHLVHYLCEEELAISINCTLYGRNKFKHTDIFFPSKEKLKWLSEKNCLFSIKISKCKNCNRWR